MNARWLAPALAILLSAVPGAAQDLSPAIQAAALCAPVGTVPPQRAPYIVGPDSLQPTLRAVGDNVPIFGVTADAVGLGQRFFIRRTMSFHGAPKASHTIGWLHITKAEGTIATGTIDFACDAIAPGDRLEPYVDPGLPPFIDRTDATGTPDFARTGRVLYGADGRQMAGGRDFMLASIGQDRGVAPGARYAVYRQVSANAAPGASFAEAVVVSVFPDKSLLRVTDAHEEVANGDVLVLRVGGTGPGDAAADAQQSFGGSGGEGSASEIVPVREQEDVAASSDEPVRSLTFEDLYFDFDRYTLRAEAQKELDEAVKTLDSNPAFRIQIAGHTCNIGTAEYNLALGERRAKAVQDYLVAHGVPANRLAIVSYGEEEPKYDNTRAETRRLNRRAALVVTVQRGN
jgi:peptidoglycan-associated lipoprotein